MEGFEFLATSYIFLSCCYVKFIQSDDGIFLSIDSAFKVISHIIHEKTFEFSLKPEYAFISLHVDIKCAKNAFLLGVYILNNIESFHVYGYTNPVEELLIDRRGVLGCVQTTDLLQVQDEICLKLFHVKLKVIA